MVNGYKMDGIIISITAFEKYIINTSDHVWYGILRREFKNKKYTLSGWKEVLNELKARPAK
jgi:hypothetical protein